MLEPQDDMPLYVLDTEGNMRIVIDVIEERETGGDRRLLKRVIATATVPHSERADKVIAVCEADTAIAALKGAAIAACDVADLRYRVDRFTLGDRRKAQTDDSSADAS